MYRQRTSNRFRPGLDSLPSRITPSDLTGTAPAAETTTAPPADPWATPPAADDPIWGIMHDKPAAGEQLSIPLVVLPGDPPPSPIAIMITTMGPLSSTTPPAPGTWGPTCSTPCTTVLVPV